MMRHSIQIVSLFCALGLVACGADKTTGTPPTAVVVAIGELSNTATPTLPPTGTPLKTPVPQPTLTVAPTPQEVIVTRLDTYTDATPGEPLVIGDALPDIELTATDGSVHNLGDLGGRPVLINFWTLGCGSCFFEFPEMQAIYAARGQETGLLPIAINVHENAQQASSVAGYLDVTFPVVIDPGGALFAGAFGGRFVPTNYFVGPDGTITEIIIGPLDRSVIERELADMGF